jgi:hypothetical protein
VIKKKRLELGGKGAFEYLVGWAGKDPDGHAWADSWGPEKLITADVCAQFESKLVKARAQEVTVDVAPLIDAVGDSIARAVLLAKTASRPMEHCLILDAFTAPALARALLDQVRRPMAFGGLPGPTLELNTVTVGEFERLQVGLSELKHIEAFCSFDPVLWNGARCALHCGLWSARARAQGTAPPAVHVRWCARYRADVSRSRGA